MLYICLANMARNNIISKREIRMMMCPTNAHISIGTPYVLQMILGKIYDEEDYKRYTKLCKTISDIGTWFHRKMPFSINYIALNGKLRVPSVLRRPEERYKNIKYYPEDDSDYEEEEEEEEEEDAYNSAEEEEFKKSIIPLGDRSSPNIDYSENTIMYQHIIQPSQTLLDNLTIVLNIYQKCCETPNISRPHLQQRLTHLYYHCKDNTNLKDRLLQISRHSKDVRDNLWKMFQRIKFIGAPFVIFRDLFECFRSHYRLLYDVTKTILRNYVVDTKSVQSAMKEIRDQTARVLVNYNKYRQFTIKENHHY